MAEKTLTESCMQAEAGTTSQQQGNKLFQTISLVLLLISWIGYLYAIYSGNGSNSSHYMIGILSLSLLNADVLFKGEKTQYKVFDVLAKLEGILLFVCAIVSIVLAIVK